MLKSSRPAFFYPRPLLHPGTQLSRRLLVIALYWTIAANNQGWYIKIPVYVSLDTTYDFKSLQKFMHLRLRHISQQIVIPRDEQPKQPTQFNRATNDNTKNWNTISFYSIHQTVFLSNTNFKSPFKYSSKTVSVKQGPQITLQHSFNTDFVQHGHHIN